MCKFLEKITGTYKSNAKVVDGVLILSLPDAISPLVWRLDLDKATNAALEIQESEDGTFLLCQKPEKGTAKTIAPFATRKKAVRALMVASHAMENAPPTVIKTVATPANNQESTGSRATVVTAPAAPPSEKKGKSALTAVIGIILLLGLIFLLLNMGPQTIGGMPEQNANMAAGTSSGNTAGTPVSADDFLRNR
ncbi:MAG: hypothetical protein H6868_00345 [Rhodospirillales bacterium]|nr:hypothetical protein [Rhodospirillales bacterium]